MQLRFNQNNCVLGILPGDFVSLNPNISVGQLVKIFICENVISYVSWDIRARPTFVINREASFILHKIFIYYF